MIATADRAASATLVEVTIDLDAPASAPTEQKPAGRRWLVGGAALLVVAAVLVAVRLGGSPLPSVVPPSGDLPGRAEWIASLVDAPPRGAVAADASFARELAARVEELSRTSLSLAFGDPANRPPLGYRARVLFADDVDDRRIALLALQQTTIQDALRRYALTDVLWLAGPRGATVEGLTGAVSSASPALDSEYRVEPAAPFVTAAFGDPDNPTWVGVAPPQCQVAIAPAADLTAWRDEPAGSYLVWRPWEGGPEYWRVTCDGVVREERPAPRAAVSHADLDAVLATAAGEPDREQLGYQLSMLTSMYGSALMTLPHVVWSGGLTFSPIAYDAPGIFYYGDEEDLSRPADGPIEATMTVVTAPRARGGFVSSAWTILEAGPDTRYAIESPVFFSIVDPGAPDALVAVRIDQWRRQVLVLTPAAAATVRILSDQGAVLDHAPVGDGPVMLAPEERGTVQNLRIEALDSAGVTIAAASLARTDVGPELATAWE